MPPACRAEWFVAGHRGLHSRRRWTGQYTSELGVITVDTTARRQGTTTTARRRKVDGQSVARVKILETADRLFYSEGIRSVGIDRVVTESGVARVTFYRHFPAKDDLVVAYVEGRLQRDRDELIELEKIYQEPHEVLRNIGRRLYEEAAATGFQGCPYSKVSVEFFDREHPVREASLKHRIWFKAEVERLLLEMGNSEPQAAAERLLMLRAGAMAIAANNGWELQMWKVFLDTWNAIIG
jgi:AcrR family transcriptional regulator